jgi:hypothetical protein
MVGPFFHKPGREGKLPPGLASISSLTYIKFDIRYPSRLSRKKFDYYAYVVCGIKGAECCPLPFSKQVPEAIFLLDRASPTIYSYFVAIL